MSIICLRIGAVTRENRPTQPRMFSVWCSHRDIAQMVEKCVEAPDSVKFDIFFAVSDNKWSYRDFSHAREVVGFEPQDSQQKTTVKNNSEDNFDGNHPLLSLRNNDDNLMRMGLF